MKERTREVIEIVGIFGLIASLIFVGMQMMLDRRIAMGNQFHDRTEIGHEGMIAQFQSDAWVAMQAREWEAGFLPDWWNEKITAYQQEHGYSMKDIVRLELSARMRLVRMNNNYFQHQLGLISDETWDNISPSGEVYQRDPVYAAVAAQGGGVLEPGYRKLIQEALESIERTSSL